VLPEELTIYTIGELRPAWLQWLDDAAPDGPVDAASEDLFRVDGTAVQDVDAAGIQLVLSLDRALSQQQGRRLKVTRPSTPFARACAALGVEQLLDAPNGSECLA